MCYPPPGPRCSSHANAEWLKAVAVLEKETNPDRRIRLQLKVDETLRAFHATPRGQNRLIREMGALSGNPEENKDELTKLSLQLRDGQLTRKNQMAAYLAMKNSKTDSIKQLLNTSNKQEQAVGIAFHVLMDLLPEEEADKVHIVSSNLIQYGEKKILCLPQKHQRLFGTVKVEDDGYLSSSDLPVEMLDILADFPEASTVPKNKAPELAQWFLQTLEEAGVEFLAVVDVKTENLFFEHITSLLAHYDVSFTQKRKLGGTSPYLHGETDLLKENLTGTPLENCEVVVAAVHQQKHTYVLNAPYLEPGERHTQHFFFSEKVTPEGNRFYEVRTRHQSSQYEVFIRLTRKAQVLPRTDTAAVKKFVLQNFYETDPVGTEKNG